MASKTTQYCFVGFASIFRLLLLGLIIVGVLTYMAAPYNKNYFIVALATCVLYGMSDFLLNWVLSLACQCRHCGRDKE